MSRLAKALKASRHALDFDDGIKRVTIDRGDIYGHPLTNFERIAHLKAGVAGCKDPAIRHALEMICVNMSRLVQTPDHDDSILDIAGYARTMAMILDEREKRDVSEETKITPR